MKFGKTLIAHQIPEWSHSYLNYKDLKQKIKTIVRIKNSQWQQSQAYNSSGTPVLAYDNYTSKSTNSLHSSDGSGTGTEITDELEKSLASFFYALDRNLEKVNDFYNLKHTEYSRRLNHLSALLHSASRSDLEYEEIMEIIGVLLELRSNYRNLKWFAELNKRGFVKILKKCDKKVGTNLQDRYLESRVFTLPFALGSTLESELNSVNQLIAEFTPDSPDIVNNGIYTQDAGSNSSTGSLGRSITPFSSERRLSSSSAGRYEDLKEYILNDDVMSVMSVLSTESEPTSNKTLLSLFSKAAHHKSFQCLGYLLGKLDSLTDASEINSRNFFHQYVIGLGKQESKNSFTIDSESSLKGLNGLKDTLNGNGKIKFRQPFINPSETPSADRRLFRNFGSDGVNSNDEVDVLIFILDKLPEKLRFSLMATDEYRRTPLHYSSQYGLKSITEVLLKYMNAWKLYDNTIPLDQPVWFDREYLSPVYLAVVGKHPVTTKVLVQSMDRSCRLSCHEMILIAARLNCEPLLDTLLAYGLDINYQDTDTGETALYVAAKHNLVSVVRHLIARGADMELGDYSFDWTPIFVAAVEGYGEVVEVLKEAGANYKRKDGSGWTPMEHAALRGHIAVAEGIKFDLSDEIESETIASSLAGSMSSINLDRAIAEEAYALSEEDNGFNLIRRAKTPEINGMENGGSHKKSAKGSMSPSSNLDTDLPAVKSFGHRYLKDESMIYIMLGSNDIRSKIQPVELEKVPFTKALSTDLDTALSLVVTSVNGSGAPVVIDLPIHDNRSVEPITFYSSKPDDVIIKFDIVPTYAGNRKPVGRAIAILKDVKLQLGANRQMLKQVVTIPVLKSETLDVLGKVSFEYQVITPFHHPEMGIEKSATYWKSLISTRVIGHRGLGKNSVSKKSLQLGENTVESFIAAANLGASYVEFDVQLTKDLVPVIYHDFLVAETGLDVPMYNLTRDQFLALFEGKKREKCKDRKIIKENTHNEKESDYDPERNGNDGTRAGRVMRSASDVTSRRPRSLSFSKSSTDETDGIDDRLKHTRDYKTKGFKGNSPGISVHSPFATLEQLFKTLPKGVGFNIECKYPMADEAEAEDMENIAIDLNVWVDTVLKCVYDNANGRDIIFSSFHPDICMMLSMKQPSIPVLFLTESGTAPMYDIRASSLQEAVRHARQWNLLGIVSESTPLIEFPRLISVVKESGLVCVSYGVGNNDPRNSKLQMKYGVDAVIVDSVLAVRKGLTEES